MYRTIIRFRNKERVLLFHSKFKQKKSAHTIFFSSFLTVPLNMVSMQWHYGKWNKKQKNRKIYFKKLNGMHICSISANAYSICVFGMKTNRNEIERWSSNLQSVIVVMYYFQSIEVSVSALLPPMFVKLCIHM